VLKAKAKSLSAVIITNSPCKKQLKKKVTKEAAIFAKKLLFF
jgi:hypothetical protein